MTLTTLFDDADDIKIEYVKPKSEEHIHEVDINRTEIVAETELGSTGFNFDTEIDIEEETKEQFVLTNHVFSNETLNNHQFSETPNNQLRETPTNQLSLLYKFKCNQCSATFIRNDALISHMKIHAGSRAYTCDYCSKSFSRRNVIRHMKAVHVKKDPKFYECYVCGAKYEKLFYLKNHLNLHYDDGNAFQCKICFEKFAYQFVLTKHVNSKHAKENETKISEKVYQCTDCTFATASKDYFKKHLQKHTSKTIQPSMNSCKICQKMFATNSAYRQHIQGHLKLFKCDSCPKTFNNKCKLKRHSAVHSTIDLTCPICDRQVKRGTLKRHMRIHVTEKNFKCDICPRAFSLLVNLNKHKLQHVIGNKYQCYMCTFNSKTLAVLKFHFSKHTGKKIFKCNVCFRRFLQQDHWRSHVGQHTRGTYPCDFCSKAFPYFATLKRHMSWHNNSFECTICSRIFRAKASLEKHIRAVHNVERPHKCEVCLKMFSEKSNLRRHITSVHLPKNPTGIEYRCTVCTYVTHSKERLISHSRWHKTERPHACIDCPKTFKTSSCLRKHMKGCHSKQPKIYTCKICFETFKDRSSRLKHKRVHIATRNTPIYKCNICSIQTKTEYLLKKHMNVHTQPFPCRICSKKFSTKGMFLVFILQKKFDCTVAIEK